jgi:hypothetical protein
MATAKLAAVPVVPRVDSVPGVAAAQAAVGRVEAELAAVEVEIRELEAARLSAADPRQARAEALLRGEEPNPFNPSAEVNRLTVLRVRRNDLRRALELGERNVATAKSAASREVVPQYVEQHRDLVRDICAKAVALSRAHQAETDFRRALTDAGYLISSWVRPMPYTGHVLRVDEPWSSVNIYLKEALEYGFITPSDLAELSPVLAKSLGRKA